MIADGCVAVAGGRIVDVGRHDELSSRFGQSRRDIVELGDRIILPGLVNSHVHLELSHLAPGEPPASFIDWLGRLIPQPSANAASPAFHAAEQGIAQCRRFGVTCVGDISRQPAEVRSALSSASLRGVSFGEVTAMAQRRSFLEHRIAGALDGSMLGTRFRVGLSPHAPYSIERAGYERCLKIAQERSLPLTTHLAETPDEAEFLSSHAGPFRELWNRIGAWDELVLRFEGGPIRFAQAIGLLDTPTLLAHVNICDDAELQLLARGKASVVYCPRTHAYFGRAPHRWRQMLAAGINVAIGTDSCASSGTLNLIDDIRLLRSIEPDVSPELLWEMITTRAARALLMSDVGAIEVGHHADLIAFDAKGASPLADILDSDSCPTWTLFNGKIQTL